MAHMRGKKAWASPVVRRYGTFAELTLHTKKPGADVKTVLGADHFCSSPPTANAPIRAGCGPDVS